MARYLALLPLFCAIGAAAVDPIECDIGDGTKGTLTCANECLSAAQCSFADLNIKDCNALLNDGFCDAGNFMSDFGNYIDFNCPMYNNDNNACAPLGIEGGQCVTDGEQATGADYSCSNGGVCAKVGTTDFSICECAPGFFGRECKGGGVCSSSSGAGDFECGSNGECTADGTCDCKDGFIGKQCETALQTTLPQAEVDALVDFYKLSDGDQWQQNSGWRDATDPCAGGYSGGFFGVVCGEAADGSATVKELWLGTNRLGGTLSPKLKDLKGLSYVDLDSNGLGGFISYELSEILMNDVKGFQAYLTENRFYCPVPTAMTPYVGQTRTGQDSPMKCYDADIKLKTLENADCTEGASECPAEGLTSENTEVILRGTYGDDIDLSMAAALLGKYPELKFFTKNTADTDGAEYIVEHHVDETSGQFVLRMPPVSVDAAESLWSVGMRHPPNDEWLVDGTFKYVKPSCPADEAYEYTTELLECDATTVKQGFKITSVVTPAYDGKCPVKPDSFVHLNETSLKCSYAPWASKNGVNVTFGCILSIIVILVIMGWFLSKKDETIIRRAQITPSVAFMVGGILLNVAAILMLGENKGSMCSIRVWTLNLFFTGMYASLFAKVWRVWKMFMNKSKWKAPKITNMSLVLFFLRFLSIDILILIIWQFVDPSKETNVEVQQGLYVVEQTFCKSKDDHFFAIALFYKICLMGLGLQFSWEIRNVHADFSDSKYIFMGICYITLVGGVILCAYLLMDLDEAAKVTVAGLGIAVCTSIPVILLFVPKLLVVAGALPSPADDGAKTQATATNSDNSVSADQSAAQTEELRALKKKKEELLAQLG